MERNSKKEFIIDIFYLSIIFVLIISASYILLKYLFPFVLGAVIAFLVQKPSEHLSKKIKISKGKMAVILSLSLYLLFGALFVFFVYRIVLLAAGLVEFLPELFGNINEVFDEIYDKYSSVLNALPKDFDLDTATEGILEKIVSSVGVWLTEMLRRFAGKMPIVFISGIVTLVATCYIAKDFEQLTLFVKNFVGEDLSCKIVKVKNIVVGSIFKIFKGYALLCVITFGELYLGLLILKIDNALGIALLVALVDVLPVIGTGTILIPWAVCNCLLGDFSLGISLGVVYVIITLVRNFLEPKIIGMNLGVNSLFILIAMYFGLKVLGVVGLFLFPVILIVVIGYYKDEMQV